MTEFYPLSEPYAQGRLDVGDGQRIHWQASGNPQGKPALTVHGGPGSGLHAGRRKYFDPARYHLVQFSQRGCGQSLPHASDPTTGLEHNTTAHLIADMERLREHLGIEQWLLYGGSWGSTLILAYAQAHPERVSEIVICGVTMTRPEETEWLYRGVARFVPGAWEAFRDALPPADRDGDLVAAYSRLLNSPDETVRRKAAHDWATWEDAVIAHEALGSPNAYTDRPDDALMAFTRITAHYFSHAAFLEDGQLLRDAGRLAGIPGVLIHGALDLGSPLGSAWALAKAWPDAELTVIHDSGHTGSPAMQEAIFAAVERFAGPDPERGPRHEQ
ncbi:prolyl aminopeptidase [Kitasatospora sp. RG8]|uniref:prolyl aminopeptidase n=1 Tax=Kitasatospora sp. RG8 TaxID=2820815 RepID=UPI001ADF93CF|nr:prolyl aminopeptidase [Kitasatospora sp. RG8]MBP0450490.1 prolyl aminopeptidase [Kitasatospora sp. RG8]